MSVLLLQRSLFIVFSKLQLRSGNILTWQKYKEQSDCCSEKCRKIQMKAHTTTPFSSKIAGLR